MSHSVGSMHCLLERIGCDGESGRLLRRRIGVALISCRRPRADSTIRMQKK